MGKVLYKVPLEHSDLFITNVDLEKATITYTVRDKENGRLLEPESVDSKITVTPDGKANFDNRWLAVQMLPYIAQQLGQEELC